MSDEFIQKFKIFPADEANVLVFFREVYVLMASWQVPLAKWYTPAN